jgi:hypothetical protein
MPPSPQLQKWKKNQIVEAIQGVGLEPKEFEFEDSNAGVRLKHKWSESHFIIGGDAGQYVGRYVVGDEPAWPYDVYSWETLMTRVSKWLREVKLDLDTPDLWAELQGEAELLGGASDQANENTPFTREEQKDIERRLREVETHVRRTYSLPEPEMEILNAKIDYLVDAAGRLGRIDWRNAFVGAIIGYILTGGLPPESARSIFLTFMTLLRAVGHLFGHRLPELPLGGF